MGLEISKIVNEALKQLAQKADTVEPDKDYLDENEISVFNGLVEKALKNPNAGFERKDYADVVKLMTVPEMNAKLTTKEQQVIFFNKINSLAQEGKTRKEILEILKQEGPKELYDKLYSLTALINCGNDRKGNDVVLDYNSYADISDNRKEVRRAMKEFGMDTKDWKKVHESLEKAIFNELKQKADKDIEIMVANLMEKDNKLTYKDALSKVKDYFLNEVVIRDEKGELVGMHAFKGAGKKNKVAYDRVYEQALKDANNPQKIEAMRLVQEEFAKYDGDVDEQKQRKLRKKIYDDLKVKHPELKEYIYSAVLGNSFKNRITGKSSNGKLMAQAVTNHNKVIAKYIQTEEEIKSALGEKREHIFTAMKTIMVEKLNENGYPVDNAGNVINAKGEAVDQYGKVLYPDAKPAIVPLITQTADGKWDLSQLSLLLANEVGRGDHELSKHNDKIDKNTSELNRATGKLATIKDKDGNTLEDLLKTGNLTEKDTKKLLKLCGFPKEKVDVYSVLLGAAIGAVAGFVSGAAATATNRRQVVNTGNRQFYDKINVELKGLSITDQTVLPAGVSVVGATLVIEKFIDIPGETIKLSKMISDTALKSAILPAIVGALAALKNSEGEFEVTGALPSEDNIDDYATRMKKENPEYADMIIALATTFVRDGEWQKEDFTKLIDNYRGTDGKLNRKEFLGMINARIKEIEKIPEEEICDEEPCNAQVVKGEYTPEVTRDVDRALVRERRAGDTWAGIVQTYYPCLVQKCNGQLYGKNGAIRQLKIALAGGDKTKLNKLLTEGNLPETMILPSMIGDCPREDGNKEVKVAIRTAVTEEEKQDYKPSTLKTVGKNEPDKELVSAAKQQYVATDGCTDKTGFGYSITEALENLKKQTNLIYGNEAELVK